MRAVRNTDHGIAVVVNGKSDGNAITDAPKKDSIEAQLLACCAADLHSDVMVVGHHGSRTSTRRALIA